METLSHHQGTNPDLLQAHLHVRSEYYTHPNTNLVKHPHWIMAVSTLGRCCKVEAQFPD